jgi:hypothetical protein
MNSKNLAFIIVGILVLLVVGAFAFLKLKSSGPAQIYPAPSVSYESTSPIPTEQASSSPSAKLNQIIIDLAEQNTSSESGKATLMEENGKTRVSLEVTGGPKGVAQPAHIHSGKCPNPGIIKYPLTSVVDGKSETVIEASISGLLAQLPLAINVHKSAAQSKTYVACGDIKQP